MIRRIIEPTEAHTALKSAFDEAVREHAADMDVREILAIASQFVGQLIAFQDASRPSDLVMHEVNSNILTGNQMAIASIQADGGGLN